MNIGQVIIAATPVANSIKDNIMRQYPGSSFKVLYPYPSVVMPDDLGKLHQMIVDEVEVLHEDDNYLLLVTGLCYATMLARDAVYEVGLDYKLLLFDSYQKSHHEVEDPLLDRR